MATQILISQAGPLPITVNFKSPSDGPSDLFVSGSVWTQNANSLIGVLVTVDGQKLGQAQIWANPTATHMSVVPIVLPVQLKQGSHTLQLSAFNSATISDVNDNYTVVLMY